MSEIEFKRNFPILERAVHAALHNFKPDEIKILHNLIKLPLVFDTGEIRCVIAVTPGGAVWLWHADELMKKEQQKLDILKVKIMGLNC